MFKKIFKLSIRLLFLNFFFHECSVPEPECGAGNQDLPAGEQYQPFATVL